ncbi:MAG: caspase domain-containing protein [Gammaproteobacteria bacterium]
MKRALIVGIDNYSHPISPLQGCVNDAIAINNTLETNGDGAPNFSTKLLTSNESSITTAVLSDAIESLFANDADTVLFFFAGHGALDMTTGSLVSQDGYKGSWGIPLSKILTLANKASSGIKSTVIILDCCHAGFIGEISEIGNAQVKHVGSGVTILASCHRDGTASEINGHGLFTSIVLDALNGSSANICGQITPASVYSHVDQTLGAWEQRPIYIANVQTFVTLRQVFPKIPFEVLRRLPEYFPDPASIFSLNPSFESDRENVPAKYKNIPVNNDNARVFKELQLCNRHGLVVPVDAEHMYYAAIQSTGCKLTALGAHYRKLAAIKRI